MHKGSDIPKVRENSSFRDALIEMTQKKLGVTTVVDANDNVLGIFTDGDVRRALDSDIDVKQCMVKDVMTKHGKTIHENELAAAALALMESHSINALLVTNEKDKLVGILNMHDLLRARVV